MKSCANYAALIKTLCIFKDGTLVEEYRYNTNGTRIYEMNALRNVSGRSFDFSSTVDRQFRISFACKCPLLLEVKISKLQKVVPQMFVKSIDK